MRYLIIALILATLTSCGVRVFSVGPSNGGVYSPLHPEMP